MEIVLCHVNMSIDKLPVCLNACKPLRSVDRSYEGDRRDEGEGEKDHFSTHTHDREGRGDDMVKVRIMYE